MAKATKPTLSLPDQRMLDLIEQLRANGTIRFTQEFCDAIGLLKQNMTNIRKGTQGFTVEHITKACAAYNVNANWVHGLSEQVFNQQAEIRFIRQGAKPAAPESKQKRS